MIIMPFLQDIWWQIRLGDEFLEGNWFPQYGTSMCAPGCVFLCMCVCVCLHPPHNSFQRIRKHTRMGDCEGQSDVDSKYKPITYGYSVNTHVLCIQVFVFMYVSMHTEYM
jgi:hypothetical protein